MTAAIMKNTVPRTLCPPKPNRKLITPSIANITAKIIGIVIGVFIFIN